MTPKQLRALTSIMLAGSMLDHIDVMGMGNSQLLANDGSLGQGIPNKPKRVIPNGCKLYEYYGIEVVATCEKKAEKKAYKRYKQRNP